MTSEQISVLPRRRRREWELVATGAVAMENEAGDVEERQTEEKRRIEKNGCGFKDTLDDGEELPPKVTEFAQACSVVLKRLVINSDSGRYFVASPDPVSSCLLSDGSLADGCIRIRNAPGKWSTMESASPVYEQVSEMKACEVNCPSEASCTDTAGFNAFAVATDPEYPRCSVIKISSSLLNRYTSVELDELNLHVEKADLERTYQQRESALNIEDANQRQRSRPNVSAFRELFDADEVPRTDSHDVPESPLSLDNETVHVEAESCVETQFVDADHGRARGISLRKEPSQLQKEQHQEASEFPAPVVIEDISAPSSVEELLSSTTGTQRSWKSVTPGHSKSRNKQQVLNAGCVPWMEALVDPVLQSDSSTLKSAVSYELEKSNFHQLSKTSSCTVSPTEPSVHLQTQSSSSIQYSRPTLSYLPMQKNVTSVQYRPTRGSPPLPSSFHWNSQPSLLLPSAQQCSSSPAQQCSLSTQQYCLSSAQQCSASASSENILDKDATEFPTLQKCNATSRSSQWTDTFLPSGEAVRSLVSNSSPQNGLEAFDSSHVSLSFDSQLEYSIASPTREFYTSGIPATTGGPSNQLTESSTVHALGAAKPLEVCTQRIIENVSTKQNGQFTSQPLNAASSAIASDGILHEAIQPSLAATDSVETEQFEEASYLQPSQKRSRAIDEDTAASHTGASWNAMNKTISPSHMPPSGTVENVPSTSCRSKKAVFSQSKKKETRSLDHTWFYTASGLKRKPSVRRKSRLVPAAAPKERHQHDVTTYQEAVAKVLELSEASDAFNFRSGSRGIEFPSCTLPYPYLGLPMNAESRTQAKSNGLESNARAPLGSDALRLPVDKIQSQSMFNSSPSDWLLKRNDFSSHHRVWADCSIGADSAPRSVPSIPPAYLINPQSVPGIFFPSVSVGGACANSKVPNQGTPEGRAASMDFSSREHLPVLSQQSNALSGAIPYVMAPLPVTTSGSFVNMSVLAPTTASWLQPMSLVDSAIQWPSCESVIFQDKTSSSVSLEELRQVRKNRPKYPGWSTAKHAFMKPWNSTVRHWMCQPPFSSNNAVDQRYFHQSPSGIQRQSRGAQQEGATSSDHPEQPFPVPNFGGWGQSSVRDSCSTFPGNAVSASSMLIAPPVVPATISKTSLPLTDPKYSLQNNRPVPPPLKGSVSYAALPPTQQPVPSSEDFPLVRKTPMKGRRKKDELEGGKDKPLPGPKKRGRPRKRTANVARDDTVESLLKVSCLVCHSLTSQEELTNNRHVCSPQQLLFSKRTRVQQCTNNPSLLPDVSAAKVTQRRRRTIKTAAPSNGLRVKGSPAPETSSKPGTSSPLLPPTKVLGCSSCDSTFSTWNDLLLHSRENHRLDGDSFGVSDPGALNEKESDVLASNEIGRDEPHQTCSEDTRLQLTQVIARSQGAAQNQMIEVSQQSVHGQMVLGSQISSDVNPNKLEDKRVISARSVGGIVNASIGSDAGRIRFSNAEQSDQIVSALASNSDSREVAEDVGPPPLLESIEVVPTLIRCIRDSITNLDVASGHEVRRQNALTSLLALENFLAQVAVKSEANIGSGCRQK